MRILLVDDDEAVLRGVRRLLEREHHVTTATNAIAALARIDAGERFDALVTDFHMPGPNGGQLIQLLRFRAPDLALRSVLMSGAADRTSVQTFALASNVALLLKPFTAAELRRALAGLPLVEREGATGV